MIKAELRKKALEARLELNKESVKDLNLMLLESLKTLDFTGFKLIHIFLPLSKKNEPDTLAFIEWLKANYPHLQFMVPKADFSNQSMQNYMLQKDTILEFSSYGIPEPINGKPTSLIPDLVFVPLLAFDKKGYRVGYGKGFYDRFLSNIQAFKLGISYFPAVTEIKDVHLNDVKLDACLTPQGIIYFNTNSHG